MTKEKEKAVLEFIFANRNRVDIWMATPLCNQPGWPNGNQMGIPFALSFSEAESVLISLKERGFLNPHGDIFGEPVYQFNHTKDAEWQKLIADTREIGWLERNRWPIAKVIGAFLLFSASIIYTTVLQTATENKIKKLEKILPEKPPTNSLSGIQTNRVQFRNTN